MTPRPWSNANWCLGWLPTVKRVEINSDLRVSPEARQRLRVALEDGGVEFIDENGGGPVYGYGKAAKGQTPQID